MSGANREDRAAIEGLSKLSSGAGLPYSFRDASGGNRRSSEMHSVWKSNTPAIIPSPIQRNRPSEPPGRSTGRSSAGPSIKNPYARTRFATSVGIGNPVQGLHPSEPPSKRTKLDYGPRVPGPSRSRDIRLGEANGRKHSVFTDRSFPEEPIVIDDDDEVHEDRGIPLERNPPSSPDPLNISTSSRTDAPQKLMVEHPPVHPFADDVERVDGPSTEGYRTWFNVSNERRKRKGKEPERHEAEVVPDSDDATTNDPIVQYDSDDLVSAARLGSEPIRMRTPSKTQMPSVSTLSRHFEPVPPKLDLRKNVRAQMKPKKKQNPDVRHQKDPLVTSPSLGGNPFSEIRTKRPVGKTQNQSIRLNWWSFGTKLFGEGADGTTYYIVWSQANRKMTVKSGSPGTPSSFTETFQPDREVVSFEYLNVHLASTMDSVIQMQTGPPLTRQADQVHKEYFNYGSPILDGRLTFNFPRGSSHQYVEFLKWLQHQVKEHHQLDGAGAKTICDYVKANVRSQVTSGGQRMSPRPEKKMRGAALMALRKSAKTSVTQTLHIEENIHPPPARPAPRPAYNKAGNQATPPEPTRRSTRHSAPQSTSRSPIPEPDELILVYPPSGPGAVNVMRSDLKRLYPGEFLNDTLIEFGLKLWLNDLREKDPELADQIHVFSSFFYKKLQNPNDEEGYQSVKKWTSKFDLFQKKYLIVPINENLHWYLAIIYEPQYVLSPPSNPEKSLLSVLTRSRKRLSGVTDPDQGMEEAPKSPDSESHLAKGDDSTDVSTNPPSHAQEQEVEDLLHSYSSCSISGEGSTHSRSPASTARRVSDATGLMMIDEENAGGNDESALIESSGMDFDDDRTIAGKPTGASDRHHALAVDQEAETVASASGQDLGVISPDSFYATPICTSKKGKRKAGSGCITGDPEEREPDADADSEEPANAGGGTGKHDSSKTYIYTLDSLGTRHTQVINLLRKYLVREALDKKGVENVSRAEGKHVLVPVQPNYCDCGIYLLHFAKTFMKDPERYCRLISERKSSSNMSQRQADWEDGLTLTFREELIARIDSLSEVWKKDRAAREDQKKKDIAEGKDEGKGEASDSDVDIEVLSQSLPAKLLKLRGKTKAARMRG